MILTWIKRAGGRGLHSSVESWISKMDRVMNLVGWEQKWEQYSWLPLYNSALSHVLVCTKRGICPSWGFLNPLKYYLHVIVTLIPFLLDCLTVILLITESQLRASDVWEIDHRYTCYSWCQVGLSDNSSAALLPSVAIYCEGSSVSSKTCSMRSKQYIFKLYFD